MHNGLITLPASAFLANSARDVRLEGLHALQLHRTANIVDFPGRQFTYLSDAGLVTGLGPCARSGAAPGDRGLLRTDEV